MAKSRGKVKVKEDSSDELKEMIDKELDEIGESDETDESELGEIGSSDDDVLSEVPVKRVVEVMSEPEMPITDERVRQKDELQRKIGNILAEHQYMESNVPIGHEYWGLLGQFRAIRTR